MATISKKDIYDSLLTNFKTKFAESLGISVSELEIREGDIIKAILETISDELFLRYLEILNFYNSFFINKIQGKELDLRAEDFNLTRMPATKAYGYGKFKLSIIIPDQNITINLKETQVSNEDGTKVYEFLQDSITIPSGSQYSDNLAIQSVNSGLKYNEEINKINRIIKITTIPSTIPSGATLSFTNTTAITGGSDVEEDERFKERILNKLSGINKGTIDYYKNRLLNYKLSSGRYVQSLTIEDRFLENYSKIYVFINDANPSGSILSFNKDIVITNDYLLSLKLTEVPLKEISSITWYPDYTSSSGSQILTPWVSGNNWDYIPNLATGEIVFNGGNNRDKLPYPGLMSGNKVIISGSYWSGDYNELQILINDDNERVIGSNVLIQPCEIFTITQISIQVKLATGIALDMVKADIQRGVDRYINILKPGDSFIRNKLIDFIWDEMGENLVDIKIVTPADNININFNQKIIYEELLISELV